MKKVLFLVYFLACSVIFTKAGAAVPFDPDSVVRPEYFTDLKLSAVLHLSASDFSKISGRKMGLKERLAFPLAKLDMKKAVSKDSTITVGQYLSQSKKDSVGYLPEIILIAVLIILAVIAFSGSMGHISIFG